MNLLIYYILSSAKLTRYIRSTAHHTKLQANGPPGLLQLSWSYSSPDETNLYSYPTYAKNFYPNLNSIFGKNLRFTERKEIIHLKTCKSLEACFRSLFLIQNLFSATTLTLRNKRSMGKNVYICTYIQDDSIVRLDFIQDCANLIQF